MSFCDRASLFNFNTSHISYFPMTSEAMSLIATPLWKNVNRFDVPPYCNIP